MNWMKRVVAIVATVAVVLGLAGAPAHANFDGCAPGYLCVYETAYGTGMSASLGPYPPGGCYPLNGWWNDQVDSVWNRNNRRVTFHKHANCSSAGEPQDGFWGVIIYVDVQKSFVPASNQNQASSFYIWYS